MWSGAFYAFDFPGVVGISGMEAGTGVVSIGVGVTRSGVPIVSTESSGIVAVVINSGEFGPVATRVG